MRVIEDDLYCTSLHRDPLTEDYIVSHPVLIKMILQSLFDHGSNKLVRVLGCLL